MEAHLRLERDEDFVSAVSLSGAAAKLKQLPGDHDVSSGVLALEASRQADGSYSGTLSAPWREGVVTFTIVDGRLEGAVEGGAFNGGFSGSRVESAGTIRDYEAVLTAFDQVMAGKIYEPDSLASDSYKRFRRAAGEIAAVAADDIDLLLGMHLAWQDPPFSHFSFRRSHQSAEQMFAHFDEYRVGFEAATVEFRDDYAVLTVRTMMGADTIEQIEVAYERIGEKQPEALIVDLRGNSGGAFAVKPLLEHVIDAPVDAGFFVSQLWNRQFDRAPTAAEAMRANPWHGWSIVSFWKAVQESEILRVQFAPSQPNFDGPVYVLVDRSAASATELAADAFRASGSAILIGERTAGEMLSQSMFDVADGFIVSLPVADYYSVEHGRIEGNGVPVDVEVPADRALEHAIEMIKGRFDSRQSKR